MSFASRTLRQAARTATRVAAKPSTAARSYSLLSRAATATASRTAMTQVQIRGVKTLDFAGTKEVVYERADWPLAKLQDYFKNDTLALIGYGSQGHGQGLNARDNGLNVIVGVRKDGESWKQAIEDGWVPGETLFPIDEAIDRGTIIMNLLSDAAQAQTWSQIAPLITKGKTLYFSHGFSVVYKDDTNVVPPKDVDVILVAPKGSGRTVRTLFKEGRGINSSIAVWQDVTGKAKEKAIALGIAVGSGYLYETTFEKEVYSDLYGERGVVGLMGGIQGMFLAQYKVLRQNGHTPSEAFNETVEEATQSLFPLIGQYGMDYMYAACSTTARRGALDWAPEFEKANRPVFEALYESVRNGTETRRSLEFNGRKTYREDLARELKEIDEQEIWRAGSGAKDLNRLPYPLKMYYGLSILYLIPIINVETNPVMIVTKLTERLGIRVPVVQGGMQWVGLPALASAVSNAGGLGILTALSQPSPDALREAIKETRKLTDKPFGVNITLLPSINPPDYEGYATGPLIKFFKSQGCFVIHKCTTIRHAKSAQKMGVDFLSIDGFECAGHPGEEDIGGLVLLARAAQELEVPYIASGGFGDARGLVAALSLGAQGVNMGTRFMVTKEAPIHKDIKEKMISSSEVDTLHIFRSLRNTARVYKNAVSSEVVRLERRPGGAQFSELKDLVSGLRGKKVYETGDSDAGIWSAGIVMGLIKDCPSCAELLQRIEEEAESLIQGMTRLVVRGHAKL
ncbi:ketol-acid reductoisomerase [Rhizoctonia solani]|uniref:ketol-acid reductoisomerase (NADP(+)) n=1 Tax=Rhizoctonia solani TaxID=456999 RepID=A0A8H7LI29_9AGAM